ncbi:EpsI family protein [candidate division GN15 bacterium]|uniref:EpsI family protein n=1 Tax=candidate division GN15 bacterium TaxID=2072418 RepID=A0A855XCK2_9BACT|nr:MAG: EpsI family protein [candidate division GN15 bacterium]
MAKKAFLIMLALLLATFAFSAVLQFGRPATGRRIDVRQFPAAKGDWQARTLPIEQGVIAMLRPDVIFNALYSNAAGNRVDLFFSYFSGDNAQSGVHSPRNCMPGAGWTIERTEKRDIPFGNGVIPASRMYVRYETDNRVVDYFYITRHGETSNDYTRKLYTMIGALSFQPADVAFVRFIAADDPADISQLEAFESEFIGEIYGLLPFKPPSQRGS